jgi:hypothetical protein
VFRARCRFCPKLPGHSYVGEPTQFPYRRVSCDGFGREACRRRRTPRSRFGQVASPKRIFRVQWLMEVIRAATARDAIAVKRSLFVKVPSRAFKPLAGASVPSTLPRQLPSTLGRQFRARCGVSSPARCGVSSEHVAASAPSTLERQFRAPLTGRE